MQIGNLESERVTPTSPTSTSWRLRGELDDLVDAVAADPALSRHLLRVASAHRAPADVVFTLREAVAAVGAVELNCVALASRLRTGPLAHVSGADADAWRCAIMSAFVALALPLPPGEGGESIFAAALGRRLGPLLRRAAGASFDFDGSAFASEFISDDICADELACLDEQRDEHAALTRHGLPIVETDSGRHFFSRVDAVVSIFDRADVSLKDVVDGADLDDVEAEAIARLLPTVPALVAAFGNERIAAVRPKAQSLRPRRRRVLVESVDAAGDVFNLEDLTRRNVVLHGRSCAVVGDVIRLRFDFAVPFEGWVRVVAVDALAGGLLDVVGVPFVWTGAQALEWRAAARQIARAAAASHL